MALLPSARFSGQMAPVDVHDGARHAGIGLYTKHPYFFNGEARVGGAFKYDGGGRDSSV
jgi:hypothetical protein